MWLGQRCALGEAGPCRLQETMAMSSGQEEPGQVGSGKAIGSDLQVWKDPLWLPGEKVEGEP